MKKLITLLLLALVLTTVGCGFKDRTPLTAGQFADKMEAAGFQIVDATNQFEAGVVEAVYLAVGENYQIEFYVVPTVDQAQRAFEQNKADFEAAKGSTSTNKSAEVKNYSYYAQTSAGTYSVVSRTDNTFIYVVADDEYKKEISEILSDLGY
ncbi:MAG: hypothetical protein ACOX2G_11775 [Bacillota bacterium]